jgi:beta-glucosidase
MSRAVTHVLVAALAVVAIAAATAFGAKPAAQGQHGGGSPAYLDASLAPEQRAQDLVSRMSLAEKIGQMGQINVTSMQGTPDTPWDRGPLNEQILQQVLGDNLIGSILSGGGAWPPPPGNDGKAWAQEINAIQSFALARQPHRIPIIYGADAVHGHSNLSDATMFPHQVGLGATFDPGLLQRLGDSTGAAVRATGVAWNFAPDLDTQRDQRWGRSYEPYSEDPLVNGTLGAAVITGMQGHDLADRGSVAATAKHFTGYSAPDSGSDRTDATIGEAELQSIHLPPFKRAIDAGVATVMVNSGSVNGEPVHASHRLLTDVLRGQLGFRGVVVTDWQDVEALITKYHVAANMKEAVAKSVNAGIDMSMIPLDAPGFTKAMNDAVTEGLLSEQRIDQSVRRILALKFRLGLFERPYVDANAANRVVENPADRPLARKAAQESFVLLDNDEGTLPLSRHIGRVLVTGPNSDSATNQIGGWSIGWQGAFGLPSDVTLPQVTTLRAGVEQLLGSSRVVWRQGVPVGDTTESEGSSDPYDPVNLPGTPAVAAARADAVAAAQDVDAVIVAVGESPYAEGRGDNDDPATPDLPASQAQLVDELAATGKPVVLVAIAGRPMRMDTQLNEADASLMAFLPGAEGGPALAATLFGKANPSGRLPVSWPRDSSSFPLAYNEPGGYDPRYPFGHGLSYSDVHVRDLHVPGRVHARDRVRLSVDLRNSSRRGGEQVVLAFAERLGGAAQRRLVAFEREYVGAGDRERVRLTFAASQLPGPGVYRIVVGERSETLRVDG